MFNKKKNKCIPKLLRKYPCDDYLHSALYFIDKKDYDTTYLEICYTIMKSGGRLSESEMRKFKELE